MPACNHSPSLRRSTARIAEEVDFQTDTAFSCAFRREYGLPPAAWRRRQAGVAELTSQL